jgi:[protein-PII] uridylyltransferase
MMQTPQNPEQLFDSQSLADQMDAIAASRANAPHVRPAILELLKEAVKQGRAQAQSRLNADGRGTQCAMNLSFIQDELIKLLYRFAVKHLYRSQNPSTAERLAVVAVGGYGRATLAPNSDIDLLFLLPWRQTGWSESIIEFMLYALWDLRFKVGHSVRSVEECMRLSRSDSTIMTAVLEARFICGAQTLCDELQLRYRSELAANGAREFIAAKLKERDARHTKSGESRYLVEPDVKDGKGGLRDLNTLFWIAKFLYGAAGPEELAVKGIFTREETARFVKCEDFLWAVRCQLHFMGGRDDRIHFERQAELAERLGYKAHGGLKFVERFMKHYFLIAKEVGDLTRIFCAVLESQEVKTAPGMTGFLSRFPRKRSTIPESGRFKLDAGRMNVTDDEVFTNDPVNILRLFSFADLHGVSVHPDALKRVRRSLVHVTKLRHEPEANQLFVNLLTGSRDPEKTLRRLNEAGVLARFIPDFGKIVAMMQFNMYHHYTVDEHLIRSVGILSQIERGRLKEDHPVASDIIHSLVSRRVLYVAVLLHDIAKGRDEDHSIAGERIALELCPRLGLTPAETETVAWLVRHHLLMSETAQMRDLNDFKTILDFIKVVQSPERLKLLLILTVVDIRAVGPGVWNGWKGQLLRTLYAEAEPLLSGGHSSVTRKARVAAAQKAFMQAKPGWTQDQHQAWTQRHYDPYWMTVDLTHQLAHAKLVEEATARGEAIATDIRTDEFTAITELTVYAPDHPRLLALITGACAAAGANIAGAQIFTTADGMALDTILIQREFSQAEDERRRAERVTELIRKALSGELHIRQAISDVRPLTSRIKAFTVEPQVIIDNEGSNRTTVIEVAGLDRIGLLYDLTEALFRLSLNIASAHVTTFGERAVDVFYVTDLTGAKIERDTRRKTIEQELLGVLKPGKD